MGKKAVSAFEKFFLKQERRKKEFAFELNKRDMEQDNVFYARVLEKELTSVNSKKILIFTFNGKFRNIYHPGDTFGVFVSNQGCLLISC